MGSWGKKLERERNLPKQIAMLGLEPKRGEPDAPKQLKFDLEKG